MTEARPWEQDGGLSLWGSWELAPQLGCGSRLLSAAHTPGPAAYHVEDCYNSRFPSAPGVVIQGVRRPKRHDTGPFCTL